jgi:hypothetical protein
MADARDVVIAAGVERMTRVPPGSSVENGSRRAFGPDDRPLRRRCGDGEGSSRSPAGQERPPPARRSASKPWLWVSELIRIRFATARSSTS